MNELKLNKNAELAELQKLQIQNPAALTQKIFDLVYHPEGPQIIKKIPGQMIYQAFIERGKGDSLELLNLITAEQRQTIVDLDCWRKDQFLPQNLFGLLDLYAEISPEKWFEAIKSMDDDEVQLLLSYYIRVYIESDFDTRDRFFQPDENFCFLTPERRYQVEVITGSEKDLMAVHRFIQDLYKQDLDFTLATMDTFRFQIQSDLLESCYHFSNIRRSEIGILPFYEAASILQTINIETEKAQILSQLLDLPKADFSTPTTTQAERIPPQPAADFFELLWVDAGNNQPPSDYQNQFFILCNLLVSALNIPPSDQKRHKVTANQARGFINIGFWQLLPPPYKHNPAAFAALFLEKAIELRALFRIGLSIVIHDRQTIATAVSESTLFTAQQFKHLFTQKERSVYGWSQQKLPMMSDAQDSPLAQPILSMTDFNRFKQQLSVFYFYPLWFADVLQIQKIDSHSLVQSDLLSRLTITSFSHFLYSGQFKPGPLTQQNLQTILDMRKPSENQSPSPFFFPPEIHQTLFNRVIEELSVHFPRYPASFVNRENFEQHIDTFTQGLLQELSYLPASAEKIEPKYLSILLTTSR